VIGVLIAIAVVGGLVYWLTQVPTEPCTQRHSLLALPTNLAEECGSSNRSGAIATAGRFGASLQGRAPLPSSTRCRRPRRACHQAGPRAWIPRVARSTTSTRAPGKHSGSRPETRPRSSFEDASSANRGFVSQRWGAATGMWG
jgi:hypothetical protein